MLVSLLYVSASTLPAEGRERAIDEIVTISNARNAPLAVTGALISTPAHFAQILEGPEPAVDELMASILADSRHRAVDVIETGPLVQRWFPDWSLAHSGDSATLGAYIAPILTGDLNARERSEHAVRLFLAMRDLARSVTRPA